jgi:hypothetical protein
MRALCISAEPHHRMDAQRSSCIQRISQELRRGFDPFPLDQCSASYGRSNFTVARSSWLPERTPSKDTAPSLIVVSDCCRPQEVGTSQVNTASQARAEDPKEGVPSHAITAWQLAQGLKINGSNLRILPFRFSRS